MKNTMSFKAIIENIRNDFNLQDIWKNYQKTNFYAKDVSYDDLILAITQIEGLLDKDVIYN